MLLHERLMRLSRLFKHSGEASKHSLPQATKKHTDSRDCGLVDAVKAGWFQNASDELFTGFKISADDVVLDFGCGAGAATLFCAKRGAHVIYADVVPETIKALENALNETQPRKAEGIICDSTALPLPSNYVTKLIALEVLEHVESPKETLAELTRIVAPGAQLLLSVPGALSERIQQNFAPSYYFKKPNHIHIFESEDFKELVLNSGLEIESYNCYGFYWSLWMMLYWTSAKSQNIPLSGVSHDVVHPPYPPLVDEWASIWRKLHDMPESEPMRRALDTLLPKSQVIVARKPMTAK